MRITCNKLYAAKELALPGSAFQKLGAFSYIREAAQKPIASRYVGLPIIQKSLK